METIMRQVGMTLVLVLAQVCCAEITSDPRPLRALYEASNAAMRGQMSAAALETMEAVAEGKSAEVILAAARRGGLESHFGKEVPFIDYNVRTCAMEMIGRTGLPEAIDYLMAVTPEQVGADESHSIYPASKVALAKALLRREADVGRQISYLELQLTTARVGEVALWAKEELCNRGSVESMDLVEHFIKRLDPFPRGDEFVTFCRRRVEIIRSDPDRAMALGSCSPGGRASCG